MDWLDAVASLMTGCAAIVAAGTAVVGLNTWRHQLTGQAEYELARRVLRALLRVRDEMNGVRDPSVTGGEIAAAYKDAGLEVPDQPPLRSDQNRNDEDLVYRRRWRRLTGAMTELEAELLEAEVLWGSEIRRPEEQLRRCCGKLYAAVQITLLSRLPSQQGEKMDRRVEEQHRVFYRIHSEDDPDEFGKRIDESIRAFEKILRPFLSRGATVGVYASSQ